MKKLIFFSLTIVVSLICILLFKIFYDEAKENAVMKLDEEQMVHAKQAAQGIEDFFSIWNRNLTSLSKIDKIINNDSISKSFLELFYVANHEHIMSFTRLDENGVILYSFPSGDTFVKKNISNQLHVAELLHTHKPVISDVFWAVQGYPAIAMHMPIFKGSEFKGSIAILIDFKSLASRYLGVIKIGETGYSWVISRDGTILYSHEPEFIGRSAIELSSKNPSLQLLVNNMLKGHTGKAEYTFNKTIDEEGGEITRYGVYMPIYIRNTFWSIAVSSSEKDIHSRLISLRSKLFFVIGLFFIIGILFSMFGAKAWLIVKEEEKRKLAEKRYSDLFDITPQPMWLFDIETNKFLRVNKAAIENYGFSNEEFLKMTILDISSEDNLSKNKKLINELKEKGGKNLFIKTIHRKKSGELMDVEVHRSEILLNGKRVVSTIAIDTTEKDRLENKINQAILKAQEDERQEIGGELHDNISQLLVACNLSLSLLKKSIVSSKVQYFDQCKNYLTLALFEIRNLSHRLSPVFFEDKSLEDAFRILVNNMNADRKLNILISFDEYVKKYPISPEIQLNLYRILQEQMKNILKHSMATSIEIDLHIDGSLLFMRIADNGVGFNIDTVKMGIGLANMKRRAESFSGKFQIVSSPGKGCIVELEIPIKA